LRQGQATLLQLIQMGWYGRREAWAHCGYPGPPTLGA
ncbi:MAG TPA: twin-arginine translocation pathway signal protein, partial [Pseudomonas sp.]|nr:twin-arginine translocation pathway signal protein [Pseudomonas sp.]